MQLILISFKQKKLVTLAAIHKILTGPQHGYTISMSTVWNMLKELGFKYRKRQKDTYLFERPDIVAQRFVNVVDLS